MLDPRRAWDWQYDWRTPEQPCNRQLRGCSVVGLGKPIERAVRLGQFSGCEREPRNEYDVVLGTILNHVFVGAVREIVFVLDAGHFHNLLRSLNVTHRGLREPNVANLTFLL